MAGGVQLGRMVLVLGPGPERERQLAEFIASQHDKASPNYHHWLSPEEFGRNFGASSEDVQQVQTWLQQQGFTIDSVAKSGRWINFSGVSAQVEAAFGTQMRLYKRNNELHIANASDISIPATLSPVVRGVLSLDDFFSKPLISKPRAVRRDSRGQWIAADPLFTGSNSSGPLHLLTPADYSRIFDLAPAYQSGLDGSGQTIAIAARSNINLSDVQIFRQTFDLPDNDPIIILNDPSSGVLNDSDDQTEATLDVEWSGAVAPRATVELVVNPSSGTTDGAALSAAYIVDNNLAPIVSVSFGQCESVLGTAENNFLNSLWQQAAAQGMSVFVSSGDNGAAGCDDPNDPRNLPAQGGQQVSGFASTPFNTAVGGTQFNENGNDATFWSTDNGAGQESSKGYIPEMVWNESCDPTKVSTCPNGMFTLFAGSGGVSRFYTKPSWQLTSIAGVPNDGQRDVPDVSLPAAGGHDGYLLCVFGSCDTSTDNNVLLDASVVGGTSASAPAFAGIMALIDQKLAGGRQGLANYVLYALAASEDFSHCDSSSRLDPSAASSCMFNDITSGNNSVPGLTGFFAGAGYDLATGLGSVDVANLINAWARIVQTPSTTTLTATTATSVTHGQAVSFTINVSGSGGVPSGTVSLISDKNGPVESTVLANGAFTGSFTDLPGGGYNLTAHYPGDSIFGPSDSAPIAMNVAQEGSSTTITAYTNGSPLSGSIVFGQFLALDATVRGASNQGVPTGSVTFTDTFDGVTSQIGTEKLNSSGVGELISFGFSDAAVCLQVGTHSITAIYSGDNSLNPSPASPPVSVVVTKGASDVSLFLQETSLTSTQPLIAHVFVGGSAGAVSMPTGSVQFFDNGVPIGAPVAVAPPFPGTSPQADLQTTLTPGTHTILVQYMGDANYNPSSLSASTFNSRTVTVTAPTGQPAQVVLAPSSNSPVVNQVVNYAIKVSGTQGGAVPTGTVQLSNSVLGPIENPVTLQNGAAIIPYQWDSAGPQLLVARYSGDATYAAGSSAPLSVNVARATPTITLATSSTNTGSKTQISLTATVSSQVQVLTGLASDPGGRVQFFDALNGGSPQPIGVPVGLFPTHLRVSLQEQFNAIASLPVVLQNGTHVLSAQYLGDGSFNSVTSNSVTVSVASRTLTQTSLTVDSANPAPGQTVNFTVTVKSLQTTPALTGTVQIVSHTLGVVASAPVGNGVVSIPVQWNGGGFQPVSAQYSGDANYASSESSPVTLSTPTFEIFASSTDLPIVAGASAAIGLNVLPINGFNTLITFTCTGAIPAGSACSFSPATVVPNKPTQAFMTLSTLAPSPSAKRISSAKQPVTPWWNFGMDLGLVGLVFAVPLNKKSRYKITKTLIAISLFSCLISCGGGGGGSSTPPPTPPPVLRATTTTIASSNSKSAQGDTVNLTANVTSTAGGALTGTIALFDGNNQVASPVTVSNGQAQFQVDSLGVGAHSLVAKYSGDAQNQASASTSLIQVVTGVTQFQLTASGGNQSRTLNVNVLIQ